MAWGLDAQSLPTPPPNPFSVGSLGVFLKCTAGAKGAKLHLSLSVQGSGEMEEWAGEIGGEGRNSGGKPFRVPHTSPSAGYVGVVPVGPLRQDPGGSPQGGLPLGCLPGLPSRGSPGSCGARLLFRKFLMWASSAAACNIGA